MTNNKTTALIEAARRQGFENRFRGTMLDFTRDIFPRDYFYKSSDTNAAWEGYQSAWEEALAAFEPPAVREMSVDECMKELEIAYDNEIDSFGGKQYCAPSATKAMALALAKLGTIRVVES